jgi:hypothetical protein
MAKTTRIRHNVVTGTCSVYVEGMEMHCPLCRVLVRSGEHHECQKPAKKEAR